MAALCEKTSLGLLCCKADLVITTAKKFLMCNYIFKSK